MKEQLVTFETAKLAKEKGFDKITFNKRAGNGELYQIDDFPSQSLLQKWIWETHKLWVSSTPLFNSNELMGISVVINSWVLPSYIEVDYIGYDVYDGLEKGLQEGLKLIK